MEGEVHFHLSNAASIPSWGGRKHRQPGLSRRGKVPPLAQCSMNQSCESGVVCAAGQMGNELKTGRKKLEEGQDGRA